MPKGEVMLDMVDFKELITKLTQYDENIKSLFSFREEDKKENNKAHEEIIDKISEGFRVIGEKQDKTNGNVKSLLGWRIIIKGGLWSLGVFLTFIVVPAVTWFCYDYLNKRDDILSLVNKFDNVEQKTNDANKSVTELSNKIDDLIIPIE